MTGSKETEQPPKDDPVQQTMPETTEAGQAIVNGQGLQQLPAFRLQERGTGWRLHSTDNLRPPLIARIIAP